MIRKIVTTTTYSNANMIDNACEVVLIKLRTFHSLAVCFGVNLANWRARN